MPGSDGDARLLDHDGEQPADALRERVLDGLLVLYVREGPAGGLSDDVHRRRVVVVAEAKRVDGRRPVADASWHEGRWYQHLVIGYAFPPSPHVVVVLAVGEEYDAGDGVPVPAVAEHLGGGSEPLGDVGAAARREGLHGLRGEALPDVRHAQEPGHAARPGREGHHAEAVVGAEAVDDEPHGLLHQGKLVPAHAPAHVEHRHEVERRAWRVAGRCLAVDDPRSLDVHEDGEIVVRRVPGDSRVFDVRLDDQRSAGCSRGFAPLAIVVRDGRLHLVVVVEHLWFRGPARRRLHGGDRLLPRRRWLHSVHGLHAGKWLQR
ncbi:uncharacterized protein LOC111258482 [Setaria italica]|uniref:uncharacterized protein LOC111258482 n=1 Tax=Setaria italica TaxID=4555 RepID=UPI000BE59F6E|nr:uncharacterized protein LOC111258482 [Setaria italica]